MDLLQDTWRLICLAFAMSAIALAISLANPRQMGVKATAAMLGIGMLLGFAVALVGIFWDTIEGCNSFRLAWHMIKLNGGYILRNRGGWLVIGAFSGMIASWLSLITLGRFLIRRASSGGRIPDGGQPPPGANPLDGS
jgi:hypothetical protein